MLRKCSCLCNIHGWLATIIFILTRVVNGNIDRRKDCCLQRFLIGNAAHMTTMRSLQEKEYNNKWCINVVSRHPQFIIKHFEKQPMLLKNYIYFFLLSPRASERKQDVICMYAIFLGVRPIHIYFPGYSRPHFSSNYMETRQKATVGQVPMCWLQGNGIYDFTSYSYPFIPPYMYAQTPPFQLHIIFQAKYDRKTGTSLYPGSTTPYFLLLPLWSHWQPNRRWWTCKP